MTDVPSTRPKTIHFVGRTTRSNMRKMTVGSEYVQREHPVDILSIDDKYYESDIQRDIVRCLYERTEDRPVQYERIVPYVTRLLERKIQGYTSQDKLKNRLDTGEMIIVDELIDKLHQSRLRCYYCDADILVLYKEARSAIQWTLDRIDNDTCHTTDNVVVSCLGCNLNKRRRGATAFKLTMQMVIDKTGEDVDTDTDTDTYVTTEEFNPEEVVSSSEYSQLM